MLSIARLDPRACTPEWSSTDSMLLFEARATRVTSVADKVHITRLKQGVDAWKAWRRRSPELSPRLARADLRGADLSGADLGSADLSGADLSHADLDRANLSGANLSSVQLARLGAIL